MLTERKGRPNDGLPLIQVKANGTILLRPFDMKRDTWYLVLSLAWLTALVGAVLFMVWC